MKQILNTLFVMTQGAYISLDHETLKVEVDGKFVLQVPLHHLGGVVTFGNEMMPPQQNLWDTWPAESRITIGIHC